MYLVTWMMQMNLWSFVMTITSVDTGWAQGCLFVCLFEGNRNLEMLFLFVCFYCLCGGMCVWVCLFVSFFFFGWGTGKLCGWYRLGLLKIFNVKDLQGMLMPLKLLHYTLIYHLSHHKMQHKIWKLLCTQILKYGAVYATQKALDLSMCRMHNATQTFWIAIHIQSFQQFLLCTLK